MKLYNWFLLSILIHIAIGAKIYTVDLKTRPSPQISYHSEQALIELSMNEDKQEARHRNLKAITKDITNFKDLQYYGELYIGSK